MLIPDAYLNMNNIEKKKLKLSNLTHEHPRNETIL